MKKNPATKCQYRVELLEPRLLLAADWAAGLAPSWDVDSDHSGPIGDLNDYLKTGGEKTASVTALPESLDLNALLALDFTQNDGTQESHAVAPDTISDTAMRHEVVIIDTGVQGYEQLVADFEGRNGGDTYYDVHVLATDANGVQSLTEILASYTNLDALHIVSHGDNGGIQLGDTRLDSNSIDGYAQLLNGWSTALGDDADLLVYGCDLAASDAGQNLIRQLGALTQADVAASDDATGLAELGGDWDFEYSFGEIDSALAFSTQIQNNWSGLLASFTVNTVADTVDANPGDGLALDASGNTSLRAAIMEANALFGVDTINVPSGTYTLTISGDYEDDALTGDLDILQDLKILGEGAASTVIDAGGLDRGFNVIGAINVSMAGLTIQGGDSGTEGGGISNLGGTLDLTAVTIANNLAGTRGGGIYNDGDLTLDGVTISGNHSASPGGGLLNGTTASNLSLVNVTVSGNSSASAGGGIQLMSDASLLNVTITDNDAGSGGGGISILGSINITVQNTIVAGNTATSTGPDVNGAVISDGSNIVQDGSASSGFAGGEIGVDPLLDPTLSDNGGPNWTHALLAGSPAIDAVAVVTAPASDQRGFSRDASPDIGAYEFGATVNGPPVAIDDGYDVTQDTTLVVDASMGLLANDSDPELDPLLVRILDGPLNGSLTPNPVALGGEFNLSAHIADEAHPEWSPDGSQVVFHSDRDGNLEIYVANADGTGVTRLTTNGANDRFATWSPDGSQIAFSSDRAGTDDIWVMDADGTNQVRLTTGAAADGATDSDPHWAADGSLIVFVSNLSGGTDIYAMNPDGTNPMRVTNTPSADSAPSVSPDGSRIAWVSDRDGNPEIYVMDVDGGNVARLTTDAGDDFAPSWSPDGSKILFHSTRDGDAEIFVMDADGTNQNQLTFNTTIDQQPDWSADGSQIVFRTDRDGNFEIYTADILSDGAFSYTPNPGFTGIDSFTYEATDGTAESGQAKVTLTVDAASFTTGVDTMVTSATDSTLENTDLVFSVANGNAIKVDDGTTEDPVLRTILRVGNGVLNLASTTGLNSVIGDGTDTIFVIGVESAINASLDGLTYSPTPGFTGTASLQIITDTQADLLGYYNFTQTNPLGLDSSPSGGNDATPSGPGSLPDPNSVFDSGRNSDVLVLDGVDDNLIISGRFGTPTNVTIAAWVNVTTTNEQDVVSIGNSIGLRLNDTNNGVGVTGFFHDGSDWNHTDSGQFIGGDGWHHLAFTFDSTNNMQVIYIDGVALGTTSYAGLIDWDRLPNTAIGSHANGSSYWLGGMLDDVRIYDRALSTGEIQAIATDQFSDTEVISISVKRDNSAPILANDNPGLTAINEDDFTSFGDSVAAIVVDGSITDPDGAAVESIAITAVDDSNGTWQYSTNNGATWNDVNDGSLGVGHALLLDGTLLGADTQRLRFVPDPDFNGSSKFTFRAWDMSVEVAGTYANTTDSGGTSAYSTASDSAGIDVNPINDAPSFSTLGDQNVLEDSGPHTVAGFASALPGGGTDEAGQTFTYTVSSDNPSLFLVGPAIDASGTLTYTLNANMNGTARVTVSVTDSGGTTNGGVDTSADQTFDIVIGAVNDAPSFSTLGDQNVLEDSGPHTVAGFASALPGGGTDEAGQTFTYSVASDNPSLFLVGPAIDASGTLTYTLNANMNGTARVTVSVTDSGGTTNGGVDTSADQTFDIVIGAVNDAPSFSTLGDQNVLEDSGPHTVAGFATALPGGGTDEAGQTFTYSVASDNPSLFLVGPAIDASGTLTYTLNANMNGTARVTVSVTDSGGTTNGGVDTSADQTFDIVIGAVNDAPSFSTLGDQNVLEDSGPHTVAGFATALPGGGTDEAGQTFTYSVASDNPSLFLVGPAIDASGTLTYTLNANTNGTARVTVSVTDSGGTTNGGVDTSADQTFDIVIGAVNDAPSFSTLGDQNVLEDSGPHTVAGFATALPGGGADEAGQTFTYTVASDNPGLFLVGPSIDASGTLTYTLNANMNGTARVTVSVTDSGGTTNGGVDTSADQSFDIVIGAVNDAPSFSTLGDQNVLEDSGPHTVAGFATALPGGGADEAGQTFTYTVASDNPGLFLVGPAIDASGTLTYTLNANMNGTARVTVSVTDSGGTTNGGVDTSADQTFDIVIGAVNDAPSFSTLGDQSVLEDSGPHTVAGFATALPGGGADEAGQTFTYTVASDNPGLFLVGPAIDASGTLTYTLNANMNGTARVTVSVTDSGGTTNGGVDTSADQTFDIVIGAVNDAPSFSTLGDQNVLEDSGPHTVAGFATALPGGGADEAGQTFTYTVASDNPGLFLVGPAIDASGTLTYTLNANMNGTARVTVSVTDSGGTTNGGVDTSADQSFDIVIGAVNDAPSFSTLGDQNVLEDSGPHTVAGFATALPGGGADEAGQTFTYTVASDNPSLFLVGPAIDASGTLTYTVNPNFSGSATVTVSLSDSGGTANGGNDDAADQSFEIVVASIDDTLSATNLTQTHVYLEDSGPVALHDILVNVGGASGLVSATLTLSNTTAGYLSTESGNGEMYSAASGVWTIEGTVVQVNAALAAVEFVPVANNDVNTSIFTHVHNGADQGPADGLITLTVTPVNDAPAGHDGFISIPGNSVHTLTMADFGFSDAVEGHAAAGVEILSVPGTYAILTNHGAPVAAGQFVSADDIAAGHLVLVAVSSPDLTSFANLVFRVQDAGGTAAGGLDVDPSPKVLLVSINPINNSSTAPETRQGEEPQMSSGQSATDTQSEPRIDATDVTESALSEASDTDAVDAEERPTATPANLEHATEFGSVLTNETHVQTLHSIKNVAGATDEVPAAVHDPAVNTVKQIAATPTPVITATTEDIALSLNQMRTAIDEQRADGRIILNSSVASVLGLSVGYVSWLLRGGALLSSVLSAMPVWKFVDPLPVFAHKRDDESDEGGDESLAAIVRNRSKQIESLKESATSQTPADPTA